MQKILPLLVFLLSAFCAQSQEYDQAVGIRGGLSSGFEYRIFTSRYDSYKALLSTRDRGIQLTALKEFHSPGVFEVSDQLDFVYGFGIHAGFEQWHVYEDDGYYHYRDNRVGPIAGLDGLVAVEYNFWEVPLNIGLEVKPYFDLFGKDFFQVQPFDFALTIKYMF
jgi:hypothetical protein